eukprot:Skav207545  [mRNA]  locus=scaffold2295:21275:21907:+ [translate_table: standard]
MDPSDGGCRPPAGPTTRAVQQWQVWQRGASQKWQRLQLLWQVLAALWMPTVLWANTNMSRWLPAMAISHSTLVLGMAHHAYRRLQRLQQPGARLVADAADHNPGPPPKAWLRLLWAAMLALNVTWTHLGALIYHYKPNVSPRSLRCFRGFLLTLGFCVGSWGLALQYVLSEWVFLRTGLRISHFLYTEIAYVVDDSKMSTRTDSWTRNQK